MVRFLFPDYPIGLFGGNSLTLRFIVGCPFDKTIDDMKDADKYWGKCKNYLDNIFMNKFQGTSQLYPSVGEQAKDIYETVMATWPKDIPLSLLQLEIVHPSLHCVIPS